MRSEVAEPLTNTSWPGCVLARTATWALAGDDHAAVEDLTAPHAPRLLPFQRGVQALPAQRALGAQFFRAFEIAGVLSEPQIGILDMTRHL